MDKDQWTGEQLLHLHEWSQSAGNYGFALSNPKFECWLLLHFDDGTGIGSPRECSDRLKRHLPGYDKGIGARKITWDKIIDAIGRAKIRDNPPCADLKADKIQQHRPDPVHRCVFTSSISGSSSMP